jgi:putative transposase
MGYRREPFEIGQWYHCFNRGIDKRAVFDSEIDGERFQQSLYLCNNENRFERSNFDYHPHARVFTIKRSSPLVSIGAYSLMPNHFHILIQEIIEGGISRFMHKLGTSYTMYFNEKNERVGNLFYKPFRSRRVSHEAYFMHLPQYIHLNAVEMFEPRWKEGRLRRSAEAIDSELRKYRFSSYIDYCDVIRPEHAILDPSASKALSVSKNPGRMVREAVAYYSNLKT